ncbi:MAG: hypothetical protein ACK528_06035 [Alphaproteobacteria bacterium]
MTDELAKTIERLELWADYWTPHQPPEFIADLRTLIGTAKAAVRVVEMLQGLEHVMVRSDDDTLEVMACAHAVDHAVAILRGECTQ